MQLSSEFFTNNRKQLVKLLNKPGLIIVPGNGLMQRSADTTFPFRQDSNAYYLTGIIEPCATLVINTVTQEEWLMVPKRTGVHAIFDGSTDNDALVLQSGITEIIDEAIGWQRLKKLQALEWYAPAKPKVRIQEMFTNPYRSQVLDKCRRIFSKSQIDIRPQLTSLRVIKYPEELEIISEAVDITQSSLVTAIKNLHNHENEKTLEAELTYEFLHQGATGHAYQPIVASGAASCTLHYVKNDAPLFKGDILLFDIGAEINNYAADISRTIVYGKKPSSRQAEVITAVKQAQNEIITRIKPGLFWKELAELSDEIVATKLVQLQLIPKDFQKSDIRKYFPHAVSHFLGLDVHDVGDYSKPLEAGMVITAEPGIYIAEESIGVRIEDDVVITKDGALILGSQAESLV